MIQTTAITEAITTLAEAEQRFKLQRIEDERFFSELWQGLPDITNQEQANLDELRRRCLYHRSEGNLLEGTVTLRVASPLLAVAGLYDPPFRMKTEGSVRLTITDDEEVLQGRIDVMKYPNLRPAKLGFPTSLTSRTVLFVTRGFPFHPPMLC